MEVHHFRLIPGRSLYPNYERKGGHVYKSEGSSET